MRRINVTDLRRNISGLIGRVERGETILVVRHGHPVAEVTPVSAPVEAVPSWKRPRSPLAIKGAALAQAIVEERREERRDEGVS